MNRYSKKTLKSVLRLVFKKVCRRPEGQRRNSDRLPAGAAKNLEGRENRENSGDFAKWAEESARREKISFINLNQLIAAEYEKLGQEKVEPLFADQYVHTSRSGAEFNAEMVIRGFKSLKKNPLSKFLSGRGRKISD